MLGPVGHGLISIGFLVATPNLTDWSALPSSCEPTKLPVASSEAAVCVAINRIGREKIDSAPYGLRYLAADSNGIWQVVIVPARNDVLGGGYTLEIDKHSGAVVSLVYGR